jgi:glycosyltransferase involved in cell wall biosynthesis
MINDNYNNYSESSSIILSAGRLTYQKGFDILVEVAKKVFQKHNNYKWYILGKGEDRDLLERKIIEYNLTDKLILTGNVRNIDDYYKQTEIFVLTSRFEGLGMVVLEALNYNVPVVSFKCRVGPSEIIDNNVNGYLVNVGEINIMADKICYLIENHVIRKRFSQNAKKDLYRFDINMISGQWDELLSSL